MRVLAILTVMLSVLHICVNTAPTPKVNCAAVTCSPATPYCVQTPRGAVCTNDCTRFCPAGWSCNFGDEFKVECIPPCATIRCKPDYKCVNQGSTGRCKPIYSCKKLNCEKGTICQSVAGCNKTLCEKECAGCFCTQEINYVCGIDGKTYSNPCAAACQQVEVDYLGQCSATDNNENSCICTRIYDPVCGADGKVYGNGCEATCANVSATPCANTSGPVCGKDGKTYTTYCHATCAGKKIAKIGQCEDATCYCTTQWDPVCGVNGQTYGNSCTAGCAEVAVAYQGEC